MKHLKLMSFVVAGSLSLYACSNNSSRNADTQRDSSEILDNTASTTDSGSFVQNEFVMKAAEGGLAEVAFGNLAQQAGKSQDVKDFGALMVKDHSKANDELKKIATDKNISLPNSLSSEHQTHLTEMGTLTGDEFDKHYMQMMVKDHDKDIELFESAGNNETDPEIKAFATKTLPTLKGHHEKAKAIQDKLK